MRSRTPRRGWARLDPARDREASDELVELFAACFDTPAGRRVLDYLRRAFLGRRVPPTAPDAVLRHVEGQRSVVAHIESLVRQARERRQ